VRLFGRESERAAVDALLAVVRDGRGRGLLLRGARGVGKTALLDYALSRASGLRVYRSSPPPWESGVPGAGLDALFGRIDDAAPRTILSTLTDDGPSLVVVDDADNLDAESARTIAFVARRVERHPVAVLVAAVDGFRGAGLEELEVKALDPTAAEQLLDERVPLLVREAVLELAAGNPRLLRELPSSPELASLAALAQSRHAAAGALAVDGPYRDAALAWVEAAAGHEERCRGHARTAFAVAATNGSALAWELATVALGELELGLGRHDDALIHLTEVWDTGTSTALKLAAAPSLVEAALRADLRALAEDVASEFAAMSPPPGMLARCEGLLTGSSASFERAIALHVEAGARFDCARTRLLYGEALRRARRRREARAQLHAAREAFDKLGASSWATRATNELRGSGVTSNRGDVSRIDELTAQEIQVAQLVAAGATNKQVAAQLFLSPRTIDFHLRNVFAKLGITSRIQLAWFGLGGEVTGGFTGATGRRAA
jgi:DNA-binding CsgD family transcriptional regulator